MQTRIFDGQVAAIILSCANNTEVPGELPKFTVRAVAFEPRIHIYFFSSSISSFSTLEKRTYANPLTSLYAPRVFRARAIRASVTHIRLKRKENKSTCERERGAPDSNLQ